MGIISMELTNKSSNWIDKAILEVINYSRLMRKDLLLQ